MNRNDDSHGPVTGSGFLRPLAAAAAALGLFDALVIVVSRLDALPVSALATLAAGAFLFDAGAAFGVAGVVLLVARLVVGREALDGWLGAPCRLLAAALARPRDPATAAVLHRAWSRVLGLIPALAILFLVTWGAVTAFHEPVRTALFVAVAGLPAALLARATGRVVWARLVADPARDGGRLPGWVGPVSAAVFVGPPLAAAVWCLGNQDEIFGAIDPWPIAGAAVFVAVLGIATAIAGRRVRPAGSGWRRTASLGTAAALAAVILGGYALFGSTQVQLALGRGPGLARALHEAAMALLDMDRDRHPFLLGGDCAPFDPAIHPLAEDIAGNGRDENCDGIDGPPASSGHSDPLRRMPSHPRETGTGLLLVVIDAARLDHLSLHGYGRPTTPGLDRFAAGAVVFDNFFAVANHTALVLPAILAGRYPSSRPGVREVNWHGAVLRARERPIATRLRVLGWQALFFPGHHMRGFLTGFDVRLPRGRGHEPARATVRRVMDALRRLGPAPKPPALVGVHFMGPHHPYQAPERPERFGTGPVDRYDAELAHVDEALAPLLELMERPGWDQWLVAITSDHGEAFGEHGTTHHGNSLHGEEVRVPLLLRVPGATGGRRERTPAGHLDLAPTLLEWATGKAPRDLPGASLLALAERTAGDPPLKRLAFSESFRRGDMFAVQDGRRALILHAAPWLFELYDELEDPAHRRSLYHPDAAPDLRAALIDHARRATAAIEAGSR
ncbi:MAG TPA: sulfatase [Polyangia bacterium]|nr:sulfatase [Polyangia bacterium]